MYKENVMNQELRGTIHASEMEVSAPYLGDVAQRADMAYSATYQIGNRLANILDMVAGLNQMAGPINSYADSMGDKEHRSSMSILHGIGKSQRGIEYNLDEINNMMSALEEYLSARTDVKPR